MTDNLEPEQAKSKNGLAMFFVGLAIAILPLVIAIATTPPGGNIFSEAPTESGGGGGAALWLALFSLPAGFVVALIGLLRMPKKQASKVRKISCFSCLGLIVAFFVGIGIFVWLTSQ
jgi:hypothetical protein